MNKIKEWEIARNKLKEIYEDKGIKYCELRLKGCWISNGLSFAHKHKRFWYYSKPHLLGSFKQTLLACPVCHNLIENNKELTLKMFKQLR